METHGACLYPYNAAASPKLPSLVAVFSMNSPLLPTSDANFTTNAQLGQATGFAAQANLYGNYQVKKAVFSVRIEQTEVDSAASYTIPIIDMVVLPVSSSNVGAYPISVTSWEYLLAQPHRSRVATINQADSPNNHASLRVTASPSEICAIPGYYSRQSTIGQGTASPLSPSETPTFMLFIRHLDAEVGISTPTIHMTVNIKYYVEWFNRLSTILAVEKPFYPPGTDGKEEKKEGKEEKKFAIDHDDDVPDMPSLSLSSPDPKRFTCINPLHVGPHIRASTCI